MSISNNQYDYKFISDLITIDHIKEALCKMKTYTILKDYTKLNNQTVQCLSRFTKNENDKNMGILSDDTYKKEYQQIQIAATSLNDNIQQYDALKKEETKRKCQIQVIINGDLENFAKEDKLKFKKILAATLGIDSDLVSILEVKEGSIKLTVELPLDSAEKLISLFNKKDVALDQLQSEFVIKEIKHITVAKSHPDQKYIDGLINNDQYLIKEIYTKYSYRVLRFITKYGGTPKQAQDIFQKALIRLYNRFKEKDTLLTIPLEQYLYSVCRGLLFDFAKSKNIQLNIMSLDQEMYFSEEMHIKELRFKIYKECFQKLPESCKEILNLRNERKTTEIAQELNITKNIVDQRMYVCRMKLKKLIEAHPDYDKLNL